MEDAGRVLVRQSGFPTLPLKQRSSQIALFNALIYDRALCTGATSTITEQRHKLLRYFANSRNIPMFEKYLNLHARNCSQWFLLLFLFQLHFCILICHTLKTERAQLTVGVSLRNFATVLDVSIVNVINNYQNFHQRRKLDMENTVRQLRLSKPSEIPEGLCEP